MTPAQREQLNRFLAETVMGWRQIENWWVSPEGFNVIYVKEYQPVVCLRDCEPLLDKIERDGWAWEWWSCLNVYTEHFLNVYYVRIWKVGVQIPVRSADVRTEALCLAIARAYGWKEEG